MYNARDLRPSDWEDRTDFVYIGRYPPKTVTQATHVLSSKKWSNPFEQSAYSRPQAVEKYKNHLLGQPELMNSLSEELRGKNLVCHCAPLRCHGEMLLDMAN